MIRRVVLARDGMVASSHHTVSFTGARVLADGGNAIDATLAMAAVCWSALPGQCGIGGDAFAIVYEPDGRVWTVGGSGFGPDGGTPAYYRGLGLAALPLTGKLAASVPGAVAALAALHDAGASRSLPALWEPGITAAAAGLPVSVKTHADIGEHADALAADPQAAEVFLRGGAPIPVGGTLRQSALAATIAAVAANPAGFYDGPFAERAVAWLGEPYQGTEWAASGHCVPAAALTGPYAGHTVHVPPPPSPGWMVLQQAAALDGALRDLPMLGALAVDRLATAARTAFADRYRRCGSDTDGWRDLIRGGMVRAGDTTSTLAVDRDGRAVSFIQSLAFTFGSKAMLPGTGVMLNNRLGRGGYLIDGHPNAVSPRRKPLHTLTAWLVTDAGGRLRHLGNTPGGDGQVQWNMQLLSHLLDHGSDPQTAVSAARFTVYPGSDADALKATPELRAESRLDLADLRALGHPVVDVGGWSAGGSALVISIGDGVLVGGADPRMDTVVLGV